MKVVSVNVGEPRQVVWQGKSVRTAIWKQAVPGRIFAGRLNLAGDAQADLNAHGGEHRAMMVYQLDSYRYWADYLKRSDFVYGQFGENLTIDGLPDAEVCIGDRFRIGNAIFEITQPRVTCYRLGIRMNLPEMPALVVSHRRPGFYFRVLQEGHIGAGDSIEQIAEGPERMSVAQVDSLLYTSHHPLESLDRVTRIPALSKGWQTSFRALLDATNANGHNGNAGLVANPVAPPLWAGFRSLKVFASAQESQDVRSFTFATEDGSLLPDARPGQHIAVKLPRTASGTPVTRFYSLCGSPGSGFYRIGVKREDQGAASGYLHSSVRAGDTLEIGAPRGSFILQPGSTPIVLVSAGIGVTPLLAMLHSVAADQQQMARGVWWIHCARNRAHHPFAGEILSLVKSLPARHLINIYSRPDPGDLLGRDYQFRGHLDLSRIRQLELPANADFYLCGPAGFLTAVDADLRQHGIAPSQINVELFGPSPNSGGDVSRLPHLPLDNTGSGPTVTFARSGISFRWNTKLNSLLEAAEACDVPVRWSCRSGVCHSCECGLVAGELRYSPAPLDPPANGNALICCSTPVSDVELDL